MRQLYTRSHNLKLTGVVRADVYNKVRYILYSIISKVISASPPRRHVVLDLVCGLAAQAAGPLESTAGNTGAGRRRRLLPHNLVVEGLGGGGV